MNIWFDLTVARAPNTPVEWATRMTIAKGTARGLAYLHDKCRDCIIHCDVKPENILLDASFGPKVADFGLAKLTYDGITHVSTRVMGTFGYLAPEWISGHPPAARPTCIALGWCSSSSSRDDATPKGTARWRRQGPWSVGVDLLPSVGCRKDC